MYINYTILQSTAGNIIQAFVCEISEHFFEISEQISEHNSNAGIDLVAWYIDSYIISDLQPRGKHKFMVYSIIFFHHTSLNFVFQNHVYIEKLSTEYEKGPTLVFRIASCSKSNQNCIFKIASSTIPNNKKIMAVKSLHIRNILVFHKKVILTNKILTFSSKIFTCGNLIKWVLHQLRLFASSEQISIMLLSPPCQLLKLSSLRKKTRTPGDTHDFYFCE